MLFFFCNERDFPWSAMMILRVLELKIWASPHSQHHPGTKCRSEDLDTWGRKKRVGKSHQMPRVTLKTKDVDIQIMV